jgi:hypothetical protein
MIKENQRTTLYQPSVSETSDRKRTFPVLMVSLLILIVIRFLNFSFTWQMTKLELQKNPMVENQNYFFIGLSSVEKARQRLLKYSDTGTRSLAVVSYFSLLHPLVYLVSNSASDTFVELGRLAVLVKPGITCLKIFPQDVVEMKRENTVQKTFFGSALMSFLLDTTGNDRSMVSTTRQKSTQHMSYVYNRLVSSHFLKIPYLVYFYLPILLILWFSLIYGKGLYLGFLYYFWIFLFFDIRSILVEIPFFWFFNLLGIEISSGASMITGIGITMIFSTLAVLGLAHWRHVKKTFWSRTAVVVLVLLPMFLRF